MQSKKAGVARTAALCCAPLLVLALVPAAQRAIADAKVARARAAAEGIAAKARQDARKARADATQRLLLKVGGAWEAQGYDVESLLLNGADANARDEQGETAIAKSVWMGRAQDVRALLRHGAQANRGALAYGARQTALSFVRAEIQSRREHGISVGDYPEIARLLKASGARE